MLDFVGWRRRDTLVAFGGGLAAAAVVLDRVLMAGGLSGKWIVGCACALRRAFDLVLVAVALVIR